jgi:peptidoglycan hydrolase-like protein with peptidoglycan-binding domain
MKTADNRFWSSQRGTPPGSSSRRTRATGTVLLAVAVLAVAGVVALAAKDNKVSNLLGSAGHGAAAASAAPLPATVLTELPPREIINGTHPLVVRISGPVASQSPTPTLFPHVAGAWTTSGAIQTFTPAATLAPCSTYTLTVWANTIATGHTRLGKRRAIPLHVACPPITGLQQALARLGYLGADFHPHYIVHTAPIGEETLHEAAIRAYHAPRGVLVPAPSDAPPVQLGELDESTKGALMVYQSDHELEATGEPDAATWHDLLESEVLGHRDPQPYTWVIVSEGSPETLWVHRGTHIALTTPVNTGVPGAETAQGIFPIFSRFTSTTMTGTDPNGTHYVAPDVPWVNYFNGGDAVHGYPRASYGFPQSNGCVELPIEAAHEAFGMLAIGDIVDVEG